MRVKTITQWQDPDGKFHEPGEVANVTVPDLADLIRAGTVEPVPEEPAKPKEVKDANSR